MIVSACRGPLFVAPLRDKRNIYAPAVSNEFPLNFVDSIQQAGKIVLKRILGSYINNFVTLDSVLPQHIRIPFSQMSTLFVVIDTLDFLAFAEVVTNNASLHSSYP